MPGGLTGRGRRMPSSMRVAAVAVAVALVAAVAAVAIVAPGFPAGIVPFGAPASVPAETRDEGATTAADGTPTGGAATESPSLSDARATAPDPAGSATPMVGKPSAVHGAGNAPDALLHDASAAARSRSARRSG